MFSFVWFYGISNIVGYLMTNPLYTYAIYIYIYIYMIWFCLVIWHIKHCWLLNAESSLNICMKYIWFGFVWLYGISNNVGYLMPNSLYTYVLNIYDLVFFGFMAYQTLLVTWCQILNNTYVWNIYDLVLFGFMAYQTMLVTWCQILFIHMY